MHSDSAFWRDLQTQFRTLIGPVRLVATANDRRWSYTFDGTTDQWARRRIRQLLEALSRRAGIALGAARGEDAFEFWLDRLRADSPYFERTSGNSYANGKRYNHTGGYLQDVARASAEYCIVCETHAFEGERKRNGAGSRSTMEKERPAAALGETSANAIRTKIETDARERHGVMVDKSNDEWSEKERQEMNAAQLRGNIGGYFPVLESLAAQRAASHLLDLADAYVEAFNRYHRAADAGADEALELAAIQMKGAAAAGVEGKLALLAMRLSRSITEFQGLHPHRQIGAKLNIALREGKLRLKDQRAQMHDRSKIEQSSKSAAANGQERRRRMSSTVDSSVAARRMEDHLNSKGIGITEFAVTVETTDRTLRSFRQTDRIRRDIFEKIAEAMGTNKDVLLKPE